MQYRLLEKGIKKCNEYIEEMKAKRKEILDAGKDTANETSIDYSPEDLLEDTLTFGIDVDGDIYNGYGVTDHYDMDQPLCLKLGIDFTVA